MSLPTKRSATATANANANTNTNTAATSFLSSSSSSPTSTPPSSISSPPMKKTKSQPLDPNKNGLHHHDDPDFDPSSMPLDDEDLKPPHHSPLIGASRSVATNLSRKKATPPQPAKKLVIKLLKAKPTLPANFEEDTWAKLKSAICAIFLKQPNSCDLEKLYQAVNDL